MPDQPKTPLRTVRVPADLWGQAKIRAAETNTTVTAVIVAALQAFVR